MNALRSVVVQTFLLLFGGIIFASTATIVLLGYHVHHPIAIAVVFALAIFIAYVVARHFTAPLTHLAQAARRLGADIESPPISESGPTEVREASVAFNEMQIRIRAHMRDRTSMLASITHDLQTPLTRLRLRLEKVSDENLRAQLLDDLGAMRDTVREGLDLARSVESTESVQTIDLDAFLSSIVDDARESGYDVTLESSAPVNVRAGMHALRRCLDNLIDNAVHYGAYARVRSHAHAGIAHIEIRDGGSGIDANEIERAFEPFTRLLPDPAGAGSGLGLTIARNIARRYHGDVTLANLSEGGLIATVTFPVRA